MLSVTFDTEKFEIGPGSKHANKVQNRLVCWEPEFAMFASSFLVVTMTVTLPSLCFLLFGNWLVGGI